MSGYVDTDLTPRAHVQADVNSRVERVALNYFDVTARVRLAHVVFTVVAALLEIRPITIGILGFFWHNSIYLDCNQIMDRFIQRTKKRSILLTI